MDTASFHNENMSRYSGAVPDSIKFHLITLKEYPERRNAVESVLKSAGFKYRTFVFNKQPVPWKGCLDSHMKIYKHALKRKLEWIAVIEDNVCLSPGTDLRTHFDPILRILNDKKDWDLIVLGGFIAPWSACGEVSEYPSLFRTESVHGTSCYIIHKRLFSKILAGRPPDKPIDIFLSQFRQYIHRPLMFHHRVIDSVVNTRYNYLRKWWFSPSMYRMAEMWFFEGKMRMILILTICLAVAATSYACWILSRLFRSSDQ